MCHGYAHAAACMTTHDNAKLGTKLHAELRHVRRSAIAVRPSISQCPGSLGQSHASSWLALAATIVPIDFDRRLLGWEYFWPKPRCSENFRTHAVLASNAVKDIPPFLNWRHADMHLRSIAALHARGTSSALYRVSSQSNIKALTAFVFLCFCVGTVIVRTIR